MAKEFLARILRIENTVASDGSEDCVICHDKCGTLSPETGIVELGVRLPCSHIVGSACIAIWLANNNTCPLCRYECFPGQPRPYMEHGMMQGTGHEDFNDVQRHAGESDQGYVARLLSHGESQDNPLGLALYYSQQLNLSLPASFLALDIADSAEILISLDSLEDRSSTSVAAASVYIASYIHHQQRNLTDIARLAVVEERAVFNVYRAIYADRYQLVNEDWRRNVGGATLAEAAELLPSLTFPPLGYDSTDDESEGEEHTEDDDQVLSSAIGGLELVKDLCLEFNGEDDPNNPICLMAKKVADEMNSMTIDWKTTNPWTIAAACTYMASHLTFLPKSIGEISAVSGIRLAWICDTYGVMYGVREQLVQEAWFQPFFFTRSEAYRCLPAPDIVTGRR